MSLKDFYRLREDFIILGLTGKMQAGADKFVEILNQHTLRENDQNFIKIFPEKYKNISNSESIKYRRIADFYSHSSNWKEFKVIEYKDVVLLFALEHCYDKNVEVFANNICEWIVKLGENKTFKTTMFCSEVGISEGSTNFIKDEFKPILEKALNTFDEKELDFLASKDLKKYLKANNFFFNEKYVKLASVFYSNLDSFSVFLRHKLVHIVSYCLRRYGSLDISHFKNGDSSSNKFKDIYKIAEIINSIIKGHRSDPKNPNKEAHIIIDRLKNSYEMVYFREKYSGFYMVSLNRGERDRLESIKSKIQTINSKTNSDLNLKLLKKLDLTEFKVGDFKEGIFEGFDIENCVQKADYHIWYNKDLSDISFYDRFNKVGDILYFEDKTSEGKNELNRLERTNEYYIYQPFLLQVLKLTALIKQPGLITPSYIERIMQIAFNTKLNSGCISRQVGAVVTDKSFSVKGIGWNDVANGQTPCSSRDVRDFAAASPEDPKGYTQFELGCTDHSYKDGRKFKDKLQDDVKLIEGKLDTDLAGRPCSFCFKSHHNAYEAKENQVHTRSLHAEENAMLQISKYGGQPLMGGNLFTTASTCELCAKKAYQLGISNIFYIDIYPGISNEQILNNGTNIPKTFSYQGAIGRGFNKLYEPFMAQKDELFIRTNFKATVTQKEQAFQLQKIIGSKIGKESNLKEYLNQLEHDPQIIEKMVELMEKGLTEN